jgi:hypothetical protein
VDGTTYSTARNVFDIDTSSIDFDGLATVTIPYDEGIANSFSIPEQNVKFLHYDAVLNSWRDSTSGINESENTVSGTLSSLSPVVAAIVIQGPISESDEFMNRVQLLPPSFSISETDDVTMSSNLVSLLPSDQDFVMIVQVIDQMNVVQNIQVINGSLSANQEMTTRVNWEKVGEEQYDVRVLVLTDLEEPYFLCNPAFWKFQL